MVWKITPRKLFFSFLFLMLLNSIGNGYAQTIVIGTPSLGFTQACASQGFNSYNLSFTFFPVSNVQAGNQFIVELSDPSGNFGSATTLTTSTSVTSPVNVSFAMPTTVAGEAYRIRVRSTAPAVTSPVSVAFSAYYAVHNQPFSINNNSGTVSFCEGGNITLQVDNTGTPASPLFYSGLSYKWYRNFAEVSGATGPSLNVTQSGNYYAIVDYGSCVMNSYSNIVSVNVTAGINLSISSAGNVDYICDGTPRLLTSSHQNTGYVYQWFKDNVAISGATGPTYNAAQEGIYKLRITFGGCVFESNAIFLELIELDIDWNVDANEVIIPGEQLQINSVNNATSPTYQWRKDNVVIAGATTANYTVTQPGTYQLTVTETQGCTISEQLTVVVQYPIGFTVTIQNSGDYQSCNVTNATLSLSSIIAQTSSGNVTVSLPNSNFSYQWLLNNSSIAGATGTSHTVNDATQNGSYKLRVTIPTFAPIESNAISIALQLPTPVLTAVGSLCGTNSVQLNSSVTNSIFIYKWYRNNTLITGAIQPSYTTNQAGNYHLVISYGACSITSNTVNLEQNSITANLNLPATSIIIPGETKTLTATTNAVDPTFEWFRNNAIISGQTGSSINVTQNGVYKVIVTQTTGCNATQEAVSELVYPDSFNVTIAANAGYSPCGSEGATLSITNFNAVSSSETISILNNSFGYVYEWFKDGELVLSSSSTTYTVPSFLENGLYELRVTIPTFAPIESNAISIALQLETPVVTAVGSLCGTNSVQLNSSVTNSIFTYNWYRNNTLITGAIQPSYTTNQEGNYHLVISYGTCTVTSNTVNLELNSITASLNLPALSIIIPGETKTLTATTNAVNPSFEWFRNNAIISGQTTSSINVTQDGVYKVIVTQTTGCDATQEVIAELVYPDSFNVTIAANTGYSPCESDQATLSITNFNAVSSSETMSILNNSFGYVYEWFKDGELVLSSSNTTYTVPSYLENGLYELRVTIAGFSSIISNVVEIKLGISDDFTLSTEGTLCESGGSVTLSSDITNPDYILTWFSIENNTEIGTGNSITVTEPGNYFMTIDFDGCTYSSNTIAVEVITTDGITLNISDAITVIQGGSTEVIASGVDNYTWYLNDQIIATGNSFFVSEAGTYTIIGTIGDCEFTKTFTVTVVENTSIVVPNVITMNNDGINDYWSLPNEYINKEDVEVIIYSPKGKVVFRARNYQNNWPNSTLEYAKSEPVFYYTISENDEIIKRGSITVIE
ncbi:gliding motility-associated C-terminal domain-containing protein [Flavobacterium azooxidireducens]|uniref:Gliding motility-associated C-terminal domain-containing protein n=1 Tax=Flavobacterium azooxidireducens TaxID=1871076 RepID=A0ABY4KI75_9FLAO|nr:gliding motility-associated C-terminal domain-containing protein [Flavobacterium azooxidireducens]UPQ80491.1 gliding motility-associated C-terminal domain-containing protein [Flavobacterium azooxidireducens]